MRCRHASIVLDDRSVCQAVLTICGVWLAGPVTTHRGAARRQGPGDLCAEPRLFAIGPDTRSPCRAVAQRGSTPRRPHLSGSAHLRVVPRCAVGTPPPLAASVGHVARWAPHPSSLPFQVPRTPRVRQRAMACRYGAVRAPAGPPKAVPALVVCEHFQSSSYTSS